MRCVPLLVCANSMANPPFMALRNSADQLAEIVACLIFREAALRDDLVEHYTHTQDGSKEEKMS